MLIAKRGAFGRRNVLKEREDKGPVIGRSRLKGWGLKILLQTWVYLILEGQPVDFLVDSGAHHLVL